MKVPVGGVNVIVRNAVVQPQLRESEDGYQLWEEADVEYVGPWAQAVIVPSALIKAPPQNEMAISKTSVPIKELLKELAP